jgi:hypothetical protein
MAGGYLLPFMLFAPPSHPLSSAALLGEDGSLSSRRGAEHGRGARSARLPQGGQPSGGLDFSPYFVGRGIPVGQQTHGASRRDLDAALRSAETALDAWTAGGLFSFEHHGPAHRVGSGGPTDRSQQPAGNTGGTNSVTTAHTGHAPTSNGAHGHATSSNPRQNVDAYLAGLHAGHHPTVHHRHHRHPHHSGIVQHDGPGGGGGGGGPDLKWDVADPGTFHVSWGTALPANPTLMPHSPWLNAEHDTVNVPIMAFDPNGYALT